MPRGVVLLIFKPGLHVLMWWRSRGYSLFQEGTQTQIKHQNREINNGEYLNVGIRRNKLSGIFCDAPALQDWWDISGWPSTSNTSESDCQSSVLWFCSFEEECSLQMTWTLVHWKFGDPTWQRTSSLSVGNSSIRRATPARSSLCIHPTLSIWPTTLSFFSMINFI